MGSLWVDTLRCCYLKKWNSTRIEIQEFYVLFEKEIRWDLKILLATVWLLWARNRTALKRHVFYESLAISKLRYRHFDNSFLHRWGSGYFRDNIQGLFEDPLIFSRSYSARQQSTSKFITFHLISKGAIRSN